MFSFGFVPKGWRACDGQLLSINQNQALFAILGTSYGGDGRSTFALPNLQGRAPLHDALPGQSGGAARHALSVAEMPGHSHAMIASATASHANDPAGRVFGSVEAGGVNIFHSPDGSALLHPASVGNSGGGQAHDNMQPYAVSTFAIAMVGIFPSRN